MITLDVADVKTVVAEAWEHWLSSNPDSFDVTVGSRTVRVDVTVTNTLFNCGMPGYNMANSQVQELEDWVPTAIVYKNTGRGALLPCKTFGGTGQVNVQFKSNVTFNFHVNLTGPC